MLFSAARKAFLFGALLFLPVTANATQNNFEHWLCQLKVQAKAAGISEALFHQAFSGMTPNSRVIALDRKQPEGSVRFVQYQTRVLSPARIKQGKHLMRENKTLLARISRQYGVQPRYIVALWGIETNFGENTGGFSVVEALATLAYEGRRADFFQTELIHALKIVSAGHTSLSAMKGSWAGAMGQCQFMPSSFLHFAQDGNGDGRKDIWRTKEDVFASIANYLAQSGWDNQHGWGREVRLPKHFDRNLAGTKIEKSLADWQRLGVHTIAGKILPHAHIQASLVFPDASSHRAFLVYPNYKIILKWNRSLYFATAVGMLADHFQP